MDAGSPSPAAASFSDRAVASGVDANALVLRRGYEGGRAEYGEFALSFAFFAERAVSLAERRARALGLATTPERLADALARAALPDLALATACEMADAAAWSALFERFAPRLRGLAASRGASPAEAESIASALLADLALPPRSTDARTLLGMFDGAGSLFSWLAVILVRRMATAARAPSLVSLDAPSAARDAPAREDIRDRAALDPPEASADAETGERLGRALDEAWRRMTARERLALVGKYRDGLSQRSIAALLRVGEPRASRLVAQALDKVGVAVRTRLGDEALAAGRSDGAWRALREAAAERMARFSTDEPPPRQRTSSGKSSVRGGPSHGSH